MNIATLRFSVLSDLAQDQTDDTVKAKRNELFLGADMVSVKRIKRWGARHIFPIYRLVKIPGVKILIYSHVDSSRSFINVKLKLAVCQ